ncbi:polysaccharide biosynthesis/export family protein [Rubripirellula amarantea]|uniref:Polysaccharide biosynthesis/export protein n=1 Tax=Rubripirellula amarantea TaxID=2527999 RepID=A0A5C5WFK4_9BACT|nr:polysaccharide biosynthesis/export family protein [Rubripirellula amarantea]MDA8743874.1 polysaccharide biosynthesis/export family protein [Rubripirellula amarantea]TWT49636.1 Polysaccharide biosynthesis/export protein [Rubripirellula amarantea]
MNQSNPIRSRIVTKIASKPARLRHLMMGLMAVGMLTSSTGCHLVSSAKDAVPAHRLPPDLFDCPRESLAPLPFAALGQTKPADHVIGAGDTLSVYIYGVFPPTEDETPVVQRTQAVNQRYYPARGSSLGPTTGLPIRVEADGTIDLPLIGRQVVAGQTITQAIDSILEEYRAEDILQEGRERITISLSQPRVTRVVVLREDTPAENVSIVSPQSVDEIHRGSGQVIDLPVYENDVLHAMAATGGLPGTDAPREVYVIRKGSGFDNRFLSAGNLQSLVSGGQGDGCSPGVIRIPLAGCPCEQVPFTEEDITLGEGDVLYIPRRNEYFITGGLLPGGKIPLPRDEDVDVIEAIAMATGSAGGPLGLDGSVLSGGNPGYLREPTRVLILRKLPDGRQMTIRADLDRAIYDPKERIRILPNDVVMLMFKPSASTLNVTLNWFSGNGIVQAITRTVNSD